MSTPRKKSTNALVNERNKNRDALFTACREGHTKDIKKLRAEFIKSCEEVDKRLAEDERIKAEKASKKRKKKNI